MAGSTGKAGKGTTVRVVDQLKQALVNEGLITQEKLALAETTARNENEPLGQVLVKKGFIGQEELTSFIAEKLQIPYVNILKYAIDPKVLELVPEKIARHYRILPLFKLEDVLTIAMADPLNIISIDEISSLVGCRVEPVIASDVNISVSIDQWYGVGDARQKLIEDLAEEIKQTERVEESPYSNEVTELRLKREAEEKPIIKLVNAFIAQAILEDASDIHFEPKRDHLQVRFRIDGFLYSRHRLPERFVAPITSRIKIISGLDISKRRIAQDGRVGLVLRDRSIDLRTSTYPSMYGENVVLRILDKSRGIPALSELGFSDEDLVTFQKVIKGTKGIVLATGPTGGGKTTTIYSAINALNVLDKNIMTIEDPIEYEIEDIVQSQVDTASGHTFASALRSILRQDPDIIYVGEIRDLETAEIAVRSALTGHLVISTLHTNDAVGAISRLLDIGIGLNLLESVLDCSMAQRLVRKICPRCRKKYPPDEALLRSLGLPPDTEFYKGVGCEFCSGTGYRGRIGLFEILLFTREVRLLIAQGASEDKILQTARGQGMKTLLEDGLGKVLKGVTTLEEVDRVTAKT